LWPGRDRRVRIASLSSAGQELLLSTPGSSELGGTIMTAGLSEEERATLVRLLRSCAVNLDRAE
jgi:DNA-binding MarR family transcriptional regulator